MEAQILELLSRVPAPIWFGVIVLVLWIVSSVKGQQPTKLPELDRDVRRDEMDSTFPYNRQPPPLPKRGRGNARGKANRTVATPPATSKAQTQRLGKPNARPTPAVAPSAPPMTARAPSTVATKARDFLQRGGGRDAVVFSVLLGKPKSLEGSE